MKKYSEERFMTILWDIYTKTNNGSTMHGYKEFCKSHNITTIVFPVLVRHKVLERTKFKGLGRGKSTYSYAWNTIQPNIYMAQKLMDEIIKINKEGNEKHQLKIKQQKLELQKQQEIFQEVQIPEQEWEVVEMPLTEENLVQGTVESVEAVIPEIIELQKQVQIQQEVKSVEKQQRVISIAFGLILIKW